MRRRIARHGLAWLCSLVVFGVLYTDRFPVWEQLAAAFGGTYLLWVFVLVLGWCMKYADQ